MRDFVIPKTTTLIIKRLSWYSSSRGVLSGGSQRDGRFHGFDAGGYHDGRAYVVDGGMDDIRHYVQA